MEHKGYLHPDGRVRQTKDGSIGDVSLRIEHYNIAPRGITVKTWVVYLHKEHGGARFEGNTRRDAVARAMASLDPDYCDGYVDGYGDWVAR